MWLASRGFRLSRTPFSLSGRAEPVWFRVSEARWSYDAGMTGDAQRFELRITATGEVRDADGNLVSQEPIEAVAVVTSDEARALLEGQTQE